MHSLISFRGITRKTILLLSLVSPFAVIAVCAQPKKTPPKQQVPSQAAMQKMLDDAMNQEGMSAAEKAQMKEMMKGVMPAMTRNAANQVDYPEVASNQALLGKRDPNKKSLAARRLTRGNAGIYAANLFSRILAKGKPAEVALIRKLSLKMAAAPDLAAAAVLAALQGHPETAMALMAKAVQAEPSNPNWQSNLGALLTQYGYPEQSLPLLDLANQSTPGNSTILNNLAYAYMGLGETDSIKKYATMASRRNPAQPDAKAAEGIAEETGGDPVKAVEAYNESENNGPNEVIEQMIRSANGAQGGEIDFYKIRKAIAIYEYFPKDWIKVPRITDDVASYNANRAVASGFQDMMHSMEDKLKVLLEESLRPVQELAANGEAAFMNNMAGEILASRNMMSKTAVSVLRVLTVYQAQWQQKIIREQTELTQEINEDKDQLEKFIASRSWTEKDCSIPDGRQVDFLRKWNERLHAYYLQQAEEFREWLNAYITWNWCVAGNVRNTVMAQDLGFVNLMIGFYGKAMGGQFILPPVCTYQQNDDVTPFPEPKIPDFACPAVVSFPSGRDWQEISSKAANFDENDYGIKRGDEPVPNMTVAFDAGMHAVAEAGLSPYISARAGSIAGGSGTGGDMDEMALMPSVDEYARRSIIRNMMKRMTRSSCLGPRPRDLDLDKIRQLDEEAEIREEYEEMLKKEAVKKKAAGEKAAAAEDDLAPLIRIEAKVPQGVQAIKQTGLQPSIGSAPQAAGTFALNPGLFN